MTKAMKRTSLTVLGLVMLLGGYGSTIAMNADAKGGTVVDTSDATFKKDVLQANEPVFIDFYTTWCGPCKMMAPVIEELSSEYKGRVKVIKMDIEKNPGVAQALGIQSIPTFVLFKKGKAVEVGLGMTPKEELTSRIDELIR